MNQAHLVLTNWMYRIKVTSIDKYFFIYSSKFVLVTSESSCLCIWNLKNYKLLLKEFLPDICQFLYLNRDEMVIILSLVRFLISKALPKKKGEIHISLFFSFKWVKEVYFGGRLFLFETVDLFQAKKCKSCTFILFRINLNLPNIYLIFLPKHLILFLWS